MKLTARRARIIATIGPASGRPEALERMLRAGMSVARLNFSHGTHEQHAANVRLLRDTALRLNIPVGILMDLRGPKIRVGDFAGFIDLARGETVSLYDQATVPPAGAEQHVPVDFPELFDSVQPDDRLLLDDGRLVLSATTLGEHSLMAKVQVGGRLRAHKGINLPGVRLRIAAFSEKDRDDLRFGLEQGVDAVAVSFVRSVEDVRQVRAAMEQDLAAGGRLPLLIAKLERPEALDDLDAILEAVDGVMVARGDLGVELPPEQVPALQKRIIQAANSQAKLVITATQMLESMISNPLPTRAEASDVANAVFDGTDAVMLSGETAVGEYPVDSVTIMDRIVREAELHYPEWGHAHGHRLTKMDDATSVAYAARELAHDVDVAGIAVFTVGGNSAWVVSQVRPQVPILAFTPDSQTYRRLAFLWGVDPFLVPFVGSLEEMIAELEAVATRGGLLKPGQQVVIVCSFPVGKVRPPNMALLHTIGES
jgi:pyruvate kinase